MSTTSLKLPEELKQTIQHFAQEDRLSAHAFMVRALEDEVRRRRQRAEFVAQALQALGEAEAGGPVYDADETFEYLKNRLHARATGATPPAKPKPIRGGLPAMRHHRAA
ncbi:hypothetical protein PGB34_17910 [Xenophilus arseniciresistens]|uniref:Ribbon-helix-helix protein, CopG family n=1 Tax=Xenophilus arseniciresistens TaxID=1283306 RepID=A0AAE3N954_9BURK|nr:hypothetical protein [Xenophilus arseniciresistens]MDA7418245.1 hypothetical protein [Xenophilus arseniciresistens]